MPIDPNGNALQIVGYCIYQGWVVGFIFLLVWLAWFYSKKEK